jgi:hypothetical protein
VWDTSIAKSSALKAVFAGHFTPQTRRATESLGIWIPGTTRRMWGPASSCARPWQASFRNLVNGSRVS